MFSPKSPTDYPPELGARLRALRLQRNMTQAALAKRAGMSVPTVRSLESGGRGTLMTFARVAYALGRERELEALLTPDPPSTLEEVSAPRTRQRARP